MLGVVVLRLSARFFRSDPLSLATSLLILASNLGGLRRREELFHDAWGRRDYAASRPRRPRALRRGLLRPGLPVLVVVVNGPERSEA